jgi:three-Cys-motif partner protein
VAQEKFYHADTERKLQALEKYLRSYLDVMSMQAFETVYIDAFAGTGVLPLETSNATRDHGLFESPIDSTDFVMGSALRALGLPRKFSRFVFIDNKRSKIEELKSRVSDYESIEPRVEFKVGDAGQVLLELCPYLARSNVRAIVFLDPFGNQIGWDTLKAMADTKHVDLWYLFPAMLGVYRQIGNKDAKMTTEQVATLNKTFGPNDWRNAFISEKEEEGLFGSRIVSEKIASVPDVTRYMIGCLKSIYAGGVSEHWLPLGRNGSHWYSLLFAMANPSPNAVKAGHNIAKHIMTRS